MGTHDVNSWRDRAWRPSRVVSSTFLNVVWCFGFLGAVAVFGGCNDSPGATLEVNGSGAGNGSGGTAAYGPAPGIGTAPVGMGRASVLPPMNADGLTVVQGSLAPQSRVCAGDMCITGGFTP